MAATILIPLTPLRSLSTLLNWTFISISAFCMRCTAPPASATRLPRCRHNVRAMRISSVGCKLWFNNPNVPFNLGCEPGQPSPIVTPFNGEQHAGIQVLNTAQFPVDAGPLSHVHR